MATGVASSDQIDEVWERIEATITKVAIGIQPFLAERFAFKKARCVRVLSPDSPTALQNNDGPIDTPPCGSPEAYRSIPLDMSRYHHDHRPPRPSLLFAALRSRPRASRSSASTCCSTRSSNRGSSRSITTPRSRATPTLIAPSRVASSVPPSSCCSSSPLTRRSRCTRRGRERSLVRWRSRARYGRGATGRSS